MTDPQRISAHVTLLELPLPLEGLTSVNCYVITGDSEIALVDPGWSSPETEQALLHGLAQMGLASRDIGRILTTHHHWDHYTQGITWQRRHDLPVHLGRGEARSIHAWRTLEGAFPRQVALLDQAGATDLAREIAAIPVEPHERAMDFEMPARWVDDGDRIDLGGVTVRALATPGHTRGHVCFEVVEEQLLLTGDHVLPRITPSIAYEREPDARSLPAYLNSLRLVAELPQHLMLPAHGAAAGTASTRALELIEHHEERLAVIHQLVSSGRSTAQGVASAMTWTRHHRDLEDLETIHRMTAVLEAAAHLVALREAGHLTEEDDEGIVRYAVA